MKRPHRPAYWQLDAFVLLMIGLLFLAMLAHLSARWETIVEIAWSILTIGGMGIWMRANWVALLHEDQERQAPNRRCLRTPSDAPMRTIPLTPVQEHFLAVMAATERQEDSQ